MVEYLVHYEASGEGCDYTIGCNHAVGLIYAESMNAAIKKVADSFLSYPDGRDSQYNPEELDKVTIYKVVQTSSFGLDHINELRFARVVVEKAAQREKDELVMYERLKKTYG